MSSLLCVLHIFVLFWVLLFETAPKCSAEVLPPVPEGEEAGMQYLEQTRVPRPALFSHELQCCSSLNFRLMNQQYILKVLQTKTHIIQGYVLIR